MEELDWIIDVPEVILPQDEKYSLVVGRDNLKQVLQWYATLGYRWMNHSNTEDLMSDEHIDKFLHHRRNQSHTRLYIVGDEILGFDSPSYNHHPDLPEHFFQ